MNKLSFHAVRTFKNNTSRSHLITIEYNGSRSNAILATLEKREDLQDCYLIDADTKCNITLDFTVKCKGANYSKTGYTYPNDISCFTFRELIKESENCNNDINVIGVIAQPFARHHFSKSGKAIDYLSIKGLVEKPEKSDLYDGGLWYDSALQHDLIKHLFTRNELNEVVYNG